MNKRYIAVLDSGIGGISVLNQMLKIMPNERYIYLGDNKNAPYGNLSDIQLSLLAIKNIDMLKKYPLKALVLGCNTLSVRIKDLVTNYSGINTFGTFPPVESAVANGEKTLMLSTVKTAQNYTHIYKGVKNLTFVGLKNLANDIEKNHTNFDSVNLFENFSKENTVVSGEFVNKKNYYHNVILGCTHYFFIKNKIINHFCPQKVISGEVFTANQVYKYLKSTKSLVNYKQNCILFLGECAEINRQIFEKSGQTY